MKDKIHKLFTTLVFCILIGLIIVYHETISTFIIENYIYKRSLTPLETNEYSKKIDYEYVKITNDFVTKNKQDIINNIYTIIDSGMTEYTFYCDNSYSNCIADVEAISNDLIDLSILNNFVSPYNAFDKLYITTNSLGKITINIDKLYSEEDIAFLNNALEHFDNVLMNDEMNVTDKITTFHNFIIDKTRYDEERSNLIKNNIYEANELETHKATGVIKNHIALCSGYTDIMALYLNYLEVPNFKISTDEHIWNAVYIDEKWLHLDLTWDDPVLSTKEDILLTDYLLIDNETLKSKNNQQHIYDEQIYKEIATNN